MVAGEEGWERIGGFGERKVVDCVCFRILVTYMGKGNMIGRTFTAALLPLAAVIVGGSD